MGIEIGNSVIFTSVTSRISHPQSMQGVMVGKNRNAPKQFKNHRK